MSLTALSIVACATAPVDDGFSGLTQEQNPTQPEEQSSAKLPPATQNTDDDEPVDAGTEPKTPAKDASAPKDASTPPADSGSNPPPTTGGDCDPNDPIYFLKFAMEATPTLCPCSASQCCYMGLGCVTK